MREQYARACAREPPGGVAELDPTEPLPVSQKRRARMALEQIGAADVAGHCAHVPMPGHVHEEAHDAAGNLQSPTLRPNMGRGCAVPSSARVREVDHALSQSMTTVMQTPASATIGDWLNAVMGQ